MSVYIPPEVRAVLDAHWGRKVTERFGDTPPTPEEESDFIRETLAAGVPTVPLLNGNEVTTMAGQGAFNPDVEGNPAVSALPKTPGRGLPLSLETLKIAGLVLLAVVLLGSWFIKPGSRSPVPANDASGAEVTALSEGIDALVTSGDVRIPLVVPRTLEILPGDGLTATTFAVVPVQVEESDWPCPVKDFDGQPAACWVFGSVVNYLIGIPASPTAEELATRLQAHGGQMRLRLSTERVVTFRVVQVKGIERHQTEALAQRRFALTVPLLSQDGTQRMLMVGEYDPGPDLGALPISLPGTVDPAQAHTLTLGQSIQLGGLELTPIQLSGSGAEARLILKVRNLGTLPVSAGADWAVTALQTGGTTAAAEVQGAGLAAGATAEITCVAPGPVAAWQIILTGGSITVTP